MYTREILSPITSPVEDGKPIIGTWNKPFDKIDLLEIRKPFRHPVPNWVKNYRLKEWQCFNIHNECIYMEALFLDLKMYKMAQIIVFDTENNRKILYRKIKQGSGRQLPHSLSNSTVINHSSDFFFRIHNWLDADIITLDINIEATRKQPSLNCHLEYSLNSQNITPITVSLGFSEHRIMYVYKTLAPVQGDMVFDQKHISLNRKTTGFFCDYKGFFPYRMATTICNAMGFNKEGCSFGFHIAENKTKETNKNNENALWVNGKMTPLPPVLITMPNGHESNWVIQDVEGMVDLTFTPKELSRSGTNLFFTRADFIAPLGVYNGMLLDSEGNKILIKNLFGIGEKLFLRV